MNLPSKFILLWREKGTKDIFLKKFFHIKIDPFAKQFLRQEAPPPISLGGGGEVLGQSHYSPHSKGDAPKLWGRDGEGAQFQRVEFQVEVEGCRGSMEARA